MKEHGNEKNTVSRPERCENEIKMSVVDRLSEGRKERLCWVLKASIAFTSLKENNLLDKITPVATSPLY